MEKQPKKIIAALSGGVDSSAAALLLQKQGFQVIGLFFRFWQDHSLCSAKQAEVQARKAAQKLNIEFLVIDYRRKFKDKIVDLFVNQHQQGYTPNPCVWCNQLVKFDLLFKIARQQGCQWVATGHYAQIRKYQGFDQLYQAKDLTKDQSYFLYRLKPKELSRIKFPVGNYYKAEIKKIAKQKQLIASKNKESQEICFLKDKQLRQFLQKRLKLKPGLIQTKDGQTLGQHQGLALYTYGQRKGLFIGGIGPFYVVGKDRKNNRLIVSAQKDDSMLMKKQLLVNRFNWPGRPAKAFPFKGRCAVRYQHHASAVIKKKINDRKLLIEFNQPQRAITPGQSAVFFSGKRVVGGGIIDLQTEKLN